MLQRMKNRSLAPDDCAAGRYKNEKNPLGFDFIASSASNDGDESVRFIRGVGRSESNPPDITAISNATKFACL
jgi:hypothetical protein